MFGKRWTTAELIGKRENGSGFKIRFSARIGATFDKYMFQYYDRLHALNVGSI
jgi:hypothetical protein